MTFLKLSDCCPKCGNEALYEGGGDPCRGCTREFRDGDSVYFDNVPGELRALVYEEAENYLREDVCDCACGCAFCDDFDGPDEEEVVKFIDENMWFVAYKDKDPNGRVRAKQLINHKNPTSSLQHTCFWEEPPVGPGHPVYEDALDTMRRLYGASTRRIQALREADKAEREMKEAWRDVRPALNMLLQARERQIKSTEGGT